MLLIPVSGLIRTRLTSRVMLYITAGVGGEWGVYMWWTLNLATLVPRNAGFIMKHADELNVQPPAKPSLVAEAAKRAKARRAQRPAARA